MKTINAADFKAQYTPEFVIVDVREPREYVDGRVPGAVLISLL